MDRWERARRECRQLEAECDARLTVYAASGTAVAGKTSTLGSGSTGSAASTAIQMPDSTSASTADDLERLLGSLSSAVDELAAAMDRLYPQGGASPSMSHALQRHREALYELSREFRRVKVGVGGVWYVCRK